ncbi:MAG: 3'-5' exonuclease [Desulfobulbaceae bacterium]|jgi:DNA polymerase-3 subunit epsilon|nr:3'-5' exonuclease [Desulfobulbaceae bacterium]MDY0351927.1 3'-5' exonuclease [Desulfobulbaceae bacterium]
MDTSTVIILDFETTGLSTDCGDRAIEIGAVRLDDWMVTDHFQGIMNPGFRISPFIEAFTGISNDMVEAAPPCEEVMAQFAEFIGDHPLVAHNAAFDRRILDSEFRYIGRERTNIMACSMLTARRVFPRAPNHKLGTLVDYCGIFTDGIFHRALADAEMTCRLWVRMMDEIRESYGIDRVTFDLLHRLSSVARAQTPAYLRRIACGQDRSMAPEQTQRGRGTGAGAHTNTL